MIRDVLAKIVEQLTSCHFECEAGPLECNTAFIALEELANGKSATEVSNLIVPDAFYVENYLDGEMQENYVTKKVPENAVRIRGRYRVDYIGERFPVIGEDYNIVPMSLVLKHNDQALKNHGRQSVRRLAERGGLSWFELYNVLTDSNSAKINGVDYKTGCLRMIQTYLLELGIPADVPVMREYRA